MFTFPETITKKLTKKPFGKDINTTLRCWWWNAYTIYDCKKWVQKN